MGRLKRVDCSEPGITRRKRGRGFEYLYSNTGKRVTELDVIQRIKELVIPPAWQEVWICPYPNGHIQAIGTDAAGRKQYLYHPRWRARRDAEKFERMLEFGKRLPHLRAVCARHMALTGMPRERVLACAARLLDHGFFRIGTEGYAENNGTYGLATMRKEHVSFAKGVITFDYLAKGGKRHVTSVVESNVYEIVSSLKKRRGGGEELLAYKENGRWRDVSSSDINEYLKEQMGSEVTAKDFRTWNATVLAAVAMAISGNAASSPTSRKRAMARAVKEVAHYLGNTPAVCRASYIDPKVFDRYRSGWTISGALDAIGEEAAFGEPSIQGAIEEAVIDLLEENKASGAVERIA
jgi:DNA topoisomerase I